MTYLRKASVPARRRWLAILGCAALCISLHALAHPQGPPRGSKSDEDLINDVKQGQFGPATLVQLVKHRAVQAIPVMKEQFAAQSATLLKEALSSALVRLGEKEPAYWEFLLIHASAAAVSDAPFPAILRDAQGKPVRGKYSPEFLRWARTHNAAPDEAAQAQMSEHPIAMGFLAMTGDPRGRSVLRTAMSSHNPFVQIRAARGLARLQDTDSIPLIIEACQKAPQDVAALVAQSLVFFNDPRAQNAAEKFIPDRQLLEELRKLSREKGVNAIFEGW